MKEIVTYKTDDGRVFYSEVEALRHENSFLQNEKKRLISEKEILSNDIVKLKDPGFKIRKYDGMSIPYDKQKLLDRIPEQPGVYMWTCIDDNYKKYVGSARNLRARAGTFLNFNTFYGGQKINEAREKYNDTASWSYSVLEFCNEDELIEREGYYISAFDTLSGGYNGCLTTSRPEIKYKGNPSPEIVSKYEKFLHSSMFANMKPKRKQELYPFEDFKKQVEHLGKLNVPGKSVFIDHVKRMKNRREKGSDPVIEDMSVIPVSAARLLFSTSKRKVNSRCFKENGIPCNSVKLLGQGEYGYNFVCSNNKSGVQLCRGGYKTEKEAFIGYLWAKTNIFRHFFETNKEYADSETYEMVENLTYGEAEMLFCYRDKPMVLTDGDGFIDKVVEKL
jgi:group I intron endonuclease